MLQAPMLEEDIHDMKLRYELLEGDRKAFTESQEKAIGHNKDEINRLRIQNKELRDRISKIKKADNQSIGTQSVALTDIEKLNNKILDQHKRSDSLKAEARAKEMKLRDMQSELALLQSHTAADVDHPLTVPLKDLENRLDKATIKHNEALSLKRIYEDIYKEMQAEKLTFDTQLVQFEKTLKVKKQEASELEGISRDANKAKEFAKAELAKFELSIVEEKKARDKELQARRELIRAKRTTDDKEAKKPTSVQQSASTQPTVVDQAAPAEDTSGYEDLIRTIKSATGTSSLPEILAKFTSQTSTNVYLSNLSATNDQTLAQLKNTRIEKIAELGNVKYSGDSVRRENGWAIDDMERRAEGARRKEAEVRSRVTRLSNKLNEVLNGLGTLAEKLESVGEEKKMLVTEENVSNALALCNTKISLLLDALGNTEKEVNVATPNLAMLLSPYNTRIGFRSGEYNFDNIEADDSGAEDEVLDREAIKKFAMMKKKETSNKKSVSGRTGKKPDE